MKLDPGTSMNVVTVTSVEEDDEVTTKRESMDVDVIRTYDESKHEKMQNAEELKNSVSKEENNNSGSESWKEVQIQISENGIMSVTDITMPPVIENNNNTVMNNCIPVSDSSKISLILCGNEEKSRSSEEIQEQARHTISSKESEHHKSNVDEMAGTPATVSSTVTTFATTSTQSSPSAAGTAVTTPLVVNAHCGSKKHEYVKAASAESVAKTSTVEIAVTKNAIDANCPTKQNDIPSLPVTSAPLNLHLVPSPMSSSGIASSVVSPQQKDELTAMNKKSLDSSSKNIKPGCLLSETQLSVPSHIKDLQSTQSQPLALKVGHSSSNANSKEVSKVNDGVGTFPRRDTPKMAVVAPTQAVVTNSASSRKTLNANSSSSPVGYKTLKTPPKSWNQSITRLSFLSSTKNHTYTANTSGISCDGRRSGDLPGKGVDSSGGIVPSNNKPMSCGSNTVPAKPNRFFKMRNMPRYLGNPASGVKPMYQVASVNKQELVTQTTGQTSVTKPVYQVASATSQHSTPHNSTGNLKAVYHTTGTCGSNKLDSTTVSSAATHTTHSKSLVTGYHVGNQQSCKMDSSATLPIVPPSGMKLLSQPSTNLQQNNKLDCSISTQSVTQTSSDIKSVSSGVSGSSQQHYSKIQDCGTPVHITLASSSAKSVPSTCSAHSGSSDLSNASSSGKFRGNNKQESGVPLISGMQTTHHAGSVTPNKQDSIPPPVSKHVGVTLMKIDPKTLSPIVVGASSSPGTPPLPLSPSPQPSNPSSSMTPQNLKTHTQQFPLPAHSNSNRGSASPNNPLGSPFLPNLLYSSFPFTGMGVGVGGNRMAAGPPPLVRAGSGMGLGAYHPLPPSINMLFNPHHRSHTHNSTPSSQSGVPPPAVQRIPASTPQHKSGSQASNSVNSNNNINAPGSGKSPNNNAAGQLTSQNASHQRTPPPTSHSPSASQQLKLRMSPSLSNQNSTTAHTPLQAVTVTAGTNHQKAGEGKPQQKTVVDGSAVPVARTVNGEQSSGEVLGKKSDNGIASGIAAEGGGKGNREQGSSCSSSISKASSCSGGGGNAAEQGIAGVDSSSSKSKASTGGSESEQKSSAVKKGVEDVMQSQTELKQDAEETGTSNKGNDNEEGIETNKQLEKT